MNKPKALQLFEEITQLASLGYDPIGGPGKCESRHPFDVRLNATTKEGNKPREWWLRITANWDGVDWAELFRLVAEIDQEDKTRSRCRLENGAYELR